MFSRGTAPKINQRSTTTPTIDKKRRPPRALSGILKNGGLAPERVTNAVDAMASRDNECYSA